MNEDYVAATIDCLGGFFCKSSSPRYNISVKKINVEKQKLIEEVFEWLLLNREIQSVRYEIGNSYCYSIDKPESVQKLLQFTKEKCKLIRTNVVLCEQILVKGGNNDGMPIQK